MKLWSKVLQIFLLFSLYFSSLNLKYLKLTKMDITRFAMKLFMWTWKVHRLTKKKLCHNNETWHALNSIFPDANCIQEKSSTRDILWTAWKTDDESCFTRTILLHTSLVAMAAVCDCGFELVDHPPHSPDLAPSHYFLFTNMKEKKLSWWNRTPFISFLGRSWNVSSTTFQSPELLIQCEFNAGQVLLVWHNSFFTYELFISPSYAWPSAANHMAKLNWYIDLSSYFLFIISP